MCPVSSYHEILNNVRANGAAYHYRVASGLVWLLGVVSDPDAETYLNDIAALPSAADSHTLAQQSLDLTKGYAAQLGATYPSIFTVLNEALAETS